MTRWNGGAQAPERLEQKRQRMVDEQLVRRGIKDERVLSCMRRIERHRFAPEPHVRNAYADSPIPIGLEQTMSQPFIVAVMTKALDLAGDERVLEIGTGSGYQTAILAELAAEVFSVEVLEELSDRARRLLDELGYRNVHFRVGDGQEGWPEHAPYDAILAAAAPRSIPPPLRAQLAEGGRLVIPVGPAHEQVLELHVREPAATAGEASYRVKCLGAVRFVPLV